MDPISIMMAGSAIASLGLKIFGGSQASAAAQQANQYQQQIIGNEQQIEAQKHQAMELDASRKQMQELRNSQQARATALSRATNQGAQFSSGLQGGYGQISGQTNTNLLGIGQNLKIGENVFDLNSQISQEKIGMAQAQSKELSGQALSQLGGEIGSSLGSINSFATQAFKGFGGGGGGNNGILIGSSSYMSA